MKNVNNRTNYSLRTWVLTLALAPTILVSIILGSYFTIDRFYELEQTLTSQGENIIEPLAIAAEVGLDRDNFEILKKLITTTQLSRSSLVKFITIFDTENHIVMTSHHYKDHQLMRYSQPLSGLLHTELEHIGDNLIIRTPIYRSENLNDANLYDENNQRLESSKLGYVSILLNKENALLLQHRAAVIAFIIVLLGVQLNLFFTFKLVKNVTQPITNMVRVVAKIREGKLNTRVNGELIGELDILKRGINAMAGSLSEYHDEMQQNIDQATSDLRATLEQIEIKNVELDLAKKRALEASQIKSEFLANMSHELRTPLNGVIGFARQLLKTPLHTSQKDYLNTIEKSASHLLSIIDDILDFSKLDAGKMVIENMPFAFREMLDETITLLSNSAREKEIELVVDIDHQIADDISGDSMRLRQVFTNLVGNAIKFTDKGSVHLKLTLVEKQSDTMIIRGEVTDTGIGIAKAQQDVLFQAFAQADSSVSRRFGGTGLGLVITKRLINHMGGEIGCQSQQGKGSTFWFILPLQLSPYPISHTPNIKSLKNHSVLLFEPRLLTNQSLARLLTHWQMKLTNTSTLNQLENTLSNGEHQFDFALINACDIDNTNRFDRLIDLIKKRSHHLIAINAHHLENIDASLAQNTQLLHSPIGEYTLAKYLTEPQSISADLQKISKYQHQASSRENLTVLAVDDNAANLKLIDSLLKELVNNVVVINNGAEAVKIARQRKFDIIFMDIQMPDIDGISAAHQIRESSLNLYTPIIAVTAHAIAEERLRVEQCGMNDLLAKPIDEQTLRKTINQWKTKPIFTHFDQLTINWESCLIQANQKTEIALEMLQILLQSLPQTNEQIETALEKNDDKQMLTTIHKLHGASCYSGIPTTQKLCFTIESSLKKGESCRDLEPEILELQDELTKVESAIKQILSQFATE